MFLSHAPLGSPSRTAPAVHTPHTPRSAASLPTQLLLPGIHGFYSSRRTVTHAGVSEEEEAQDSAPQTATGPSIRDNDDGLPATTDARIPYVFVGDNGEGDAEAAYALLREGYLQAAFIRRVDFTVCLGVRANRPPEDSCAHGPEPSFAPGAALAPPPPPAAPEVHVPPPEVLPHSPHCPSQSGGDSPVFAPTPQHNTASPPPPPAPRRRPVPQQRTRHHSASTLPTREVLEWPHTGGGAPPPPPPLQTKVTIVGHFWYPHFWVPDPPPLSKTSLPPIPLSSPPPAPGANPHTGVRGVLKGRDFFFLLRTPLKDRPKGPPTTDRQLPSTANRHQPPTTNCHQPPPTASGDQPPTANHCQPPPTTNHQPPTAANHHQPPPTASCQLPTANRQPPTANRQPPPTMVEHMECPRAFLGKLFLEHFFFPFR